MSDINFEDYRDLLIVNAGGTNYVVEAPAHEADVSDIIAFELTPGVEAIGLVIDKMWCNRKESEYRCMGRMNCIHQAKIIYRERWSAAPTNPELKDTFF